MASKNTSSFTRQEDIFGVAFTDQAEPQVSFKELFKKNVNKIIRALKKPLETETVLSWNF
jgi:hypothetical protein